MSTIHHALVLNLHQPSGNLDALLRDHEWEAREILLALDRIPRSLWEFEEVARVHLSLSGTLLETLSNPEFQQRVYGIIKCGDLLWQLQNQKIFHILGTGYYHPVLPLIPPADREEHLARWLGIARHLFWRNQFTGFWPPEMAFSMELIPLLKRLGYRYVLVDSNHVEPVTPMRWDEIRYRPHRARHGEHEIIVIVRDRELSNAQEAGMDAGWFMSEVHERTKYCDFPPLVTTCTDGDNGGWFRNLNNKGNFWGVFYQPLLDLVKRKETEVRPTFVEEYLSQHGVHGEVTVREGAWNTGWHHGTGFLQWTGSQAQKDAIQRVSETSRAVHEMRHRAAAVPGNGQLQSEIEQAYWRLLRAETSCNFFWGEAWVQRCHQDLDDVLGILHNVSTHLPA
ncbi:MAG TPA: glycoside hydrolase family 57 [Verrucomicrobiae bacterium]|nr:glycoside hydrolase family 57 [Verrucomicrobiae bacterium]